MLKFAYDIGGEAFKRGIKMYDMFHTNANTSLIYAITKIVKDWTGSK